MDRLNWVAFNASAHFCSLDPMTEPLANQHDLVNNLTRLCIHGMNFHKSMKRKRTHSFRDSKLTIHVVALINREKGHSRGS